MRIVLTHPFCWPHVRRGSERLIDGLGQFLDGRGHDVLTLSTGPGLGTTEHTAAGTRRLYPSLWHPLLARVRIQAYHPFLLTSLLGLARAEADVVHSFFFTDGFAAGLLAPRRRFKAILQINGPAAPWAFRRFLPPDQGILRRAMESADVVLAPSRFVADVFDEHYRVGARVSVPPIDVDHFLPGPPSSEREPILASVANFDERRKGVRVLARAFERLLGAHPELTLQLSGSMSDATRAEVLGSVGEHARSRIELLGVGRVADVQALYRRARLFVLPTMWEASAYSMFEGWASGLPAVVTAHGGLPEFVTPETGVMFDPLTDGMETTNVEGLTEAIDRGLELAADPQTSARCRAHAERYAWDRLGPEVEDIYRE
ncbi:MAG: glycosyltransferase family 4 protein [Ectothiorhodospiraceae bacterium]|nr:glycosyltransferase family 4 protein [Ectothiorhodospiraceae bacterium]